MAQVELSDAELRLEQSRAKSRERMRARRAADPEGEREKLLAWKAANPEKVKAHNRDAKRKYLSVEENRERRKESGRKWRAKYPEKRRAIANAWNKANPEKVKIQGLRSTLKCKYGLTLEQRDEMFAAQDFRCAICKSPTPGTTKGWHIDHCHDTKRVRGILCNHCNLMLGYARDNETTLDNAIEYLLR